MNRPLRVALFTDSLEPSGVGRVMAAKARLLSPDYDLFLVCADDARTDALAASIAPHACETARLTLREAGDHVAKAELMRLLRAWQVDIFHNHIGATWEGHAGTRAAREAGVPRVVATEHLPCVVRLPHELAEKRAVNAQLDCLFAVSESVRHSFVCADLIAPHRAVTVQNGVEPVAFQGDKSRARRELSEELGLAENAKIALFAGRLTEQKDPWTLLYTVKVAAETEPNLVLLIAGEGPLRVEIEGLARECDVAACVRFLGHRGDMARLLCAADALLMPSRFEGLPLVALEAMAARLPVVGCDATGLRDCVTHQQTGWLSHLCDAQHLARGLVRALGAEGRAWGEAGHARFCREFTADAMAARQDSAYRALAWAVGDGEREEGSGETVTCRHSEGALATEESPVTEQQNCGGFFAALRMTAGDVSAAPPLRILWVFAWLVVGGEETEARLLAQHLDAARYRLEIVPCLRRPNMPAQSHEQLQALGVPIDTAPYELSFADTVAYLAAKIPGYDVVIASQAVPDVHAAYDLLEARGIKAPPLIEHGGIVSEALAYPKHHTARYVGVCRSIRDAAASLMPDRPHHAVLLPSMVDLSEFSPHHREAARRAMGVDDDAPLIGWAGRLDRKKRVEDFVRAAALVRETHLAARFAVIGGPDAFMPEYEAELHALSAELGLQDALRFLGDRADVPHLLSGLDALCWLSHGEGMPHIIAEAGAAGVPVVATRDNGSEEQITQGESGLFVAHEAPAEVAAALCRLIETPSLRRELGAALRRKVEREYDARAVTQQWQALFEELTSGHIDDLQLGIDD